MRINDLLCGDAPRSKMVARSGQRRIELGQFRADVAANTAALRAANCRRGLLLTQDTYWAAVGMLALFQSGAVVVMPPNALPATLASLAGEWDHLASDAGVAGVASPFLLRAGDGQGSLNGLDPQASEIALFTSGSSGDPKRVE